MARSLQRVVRHNQSNEYDGTLNPRSCTRQSKGFNDTLRIPRASCTIEVLLLTQKRPFVIIVSIAVFGPKGGYYYGGQGYTHVATMEVFCHIKKQTHTTAVRSKISSTLILASCVIDTPIAGVPGCVLVKDTGWRLPSELACSRVNINKVTFINHQSARGNYKTSQN